MGILPRYFMHDAHGHAVEAYSEIWRAKAHADVYMLAPDDKVSLIVGETPSGTTVFHVSRTLGTGHDCHVKDIPSWEGWYGDPKEARCVFL